MSNSLREAVEKLLSGPRPLPLIHAGASVLRQPATELSDQLTPALVADLIDAMRECMHAAPGVGLAAPQVGIGLRIAVIEDPAELSAEVAAVRERSPLPFQVLINPSYRPIGSRRAAFFEGCLSVPGYQAVVDRPAQVELSALDHQLEPYTATFTGWPARIVQHETDHLNGTLYLDRALTRSLTTNENYVSTWASVPIAQTRSFLGF